MVHSIWILYVSYHILKYIKKIKSITTYICYYFNKPTPYRWTLHVVYSLSFSIHLSLLQLIKRDNSQFSFDYIIYSANNTGKRFIFVIYWHKGKFNSLIFILLIFCLSWWKHIQLITRWLLIIFLHFVKRLMGYLSVIIKYRYYCG